ncbi:hypothetical protein M3J09_013843 [Ascochyta lentis]
MYDGKRTRCNCSCNCQALSWRGELTYSPRDDHKPSNSMSVDRMPSFSCPCSAMLFLEARNRESTPRPRLRRSALSPIEEIDEDNFACHARRLAAEKL